MIRRIGAIMWVQEWQERGGLLMVGFHQIGIVILIVGSFWPSLYYGMSFMFATLSNG